MWVPRYRRRESEATAAPAAGVSASHPSRCSRSRRGQRRHTSIRPSAVHSSHRLRSSTLRRGACALTAECDKTKGGAQGFISGTWNVWRTLQKSDLTSKVIKPVDPDAPPVKKKRRRKKSAPAPAPAAELAE